MMMAGRAVCVVVAALTYRISLWIALAMVVAGAVLPWCAVLIANDGPPRKRAMRPAPVAPLAEHALPGATEDRTVDG